MIASCCEGFKGKIELFLANQFFFDIRSMERKRTHLRSCYCEISTFHSITFIIWCFLHWHYSVNGKSSFSKQNGGFVRRGRSARRALENFPMFFAQSRASTRWRETKKASKPRLDKTRKHSTNLSLRVITSKREKSSCCLFLYSLFFCLKLCVRFCCWLVFFVFNVKLTVSRALFIHNIMYERSAEFFFSMCDENKLSERCWPAKDLNWSAVWNNFE